MKRLFFLLIFTSSSLLFGNFSELHKHSITPKQEFEEFYFWKNTQVEPFNELILSWNGKRPIKGTYIFYISVKSGKWSNWMKYAEWGANDQKTFKSEWGSSFARNHTDVVALKDNLLATGFQIKVVATGGANCSDLAAIFASTSNLHNYSSCTKPREESAVFVKPIFPQSQMVLSHHRFKDLCSPTSTTVTINSLLKEKAVDPAIFADQAKDNFHDIYGNWILNTAQAYAFLADEYYIYPRRLNSFDEVIAQLKKNIPVIVSVKGKIEGAPFEYKSGHLMTIVGWDPTTEEIFFIDSAHPSDQQSYVSYPFEEFNKVWTVRKNLCYFFEKKSGI